MARILTPDRATAGLRPGPAAFAVPAARGHDGSTAAAVTPGSDWLHEVFGGAGGGSWERAQWSADRDQGSVRPDCAWRASRCGREFASRSAVCQEG